MKDGEDKSRSLTDNCIMLYSGESGDTVNFAEYVQCNVQLFGIRYGTQMSTKAVASYTRRILADGIRSRGGGYKVQILIAGTDPVSAKPELYWMDYLGSSVKMNFAAHGYAAYFVTSTMDRLWKPDLTLEEAKHIVRKCLEEIKKRFIASLPNFTIKVITKDGIEKISLD